MVAITLVVGATVVLWVVGLVSADLGVTAAVVVVVTLVLGATIVLRVVGLVGADLGVTAAVAVTLVVGATVVWRVVGLVGAFNSVLLTTPFWFSSCSNSKPDNISAVTPKHYHNHKTTTLWG